MFIPITLRVRVRYERPWNKGTRTYGQLDTAEPNPLAYITYLNEKGKLMKEKSWTSWGTTDFGNFVNKPMSGFSLEKPVARSTDWFGSGRTMFRVTHPYGYQFEITANNLFEILQEAGVEKGSLLGEYILAWDGAKLALLPTSSELYREYAEVTTAVNAGGLKPSGLIPGTIYKNKGGFEYVYLGRYYVANAKENTKPYGRYRHENVDLDISLQHLYIFTSINTNLKKLCFDWWELEKFVTPKMLMIGDKVDDYDQDEIDKALFTIKRDMISVQRAPFTPEDKTRLANDFSAYCKNYYKNNKDYNIVKINFKESKK